MKVRLLVNKQPQKIFIFDQFLIVVKISVIGTRPMTTNMRKFRRNNIRQDIFAANFLIIFSIHLWRRQRSLTARLQLSSQLSLLEIARRRQRRTFLPQCAGHAHHRADIGAAFRHEWILSASNIQSQPADRRRRVRVRHYFAANPFSRHDAGGVANPRLYQMRPVEDDGQFFPVLAVTNCRSPFHLAASAQRSSACLGIRRIYWRQYRLWQPAICAIFSWRFFVHRTGDRECATWRRSIHGP